MLSRVAADTSLTSITNPTSLTSVLASAPTIWTGPSCGSGCPTFVSTACSPEPPLVAGVVLRILLGLQTQNNAASSTIECNVTLQGVQIAHFITTALGTSAAARNGFFRCDLMCISPGASGSFVGTSEFRLSGPVGVAVGDETGGWGGDFTLASTIDTTSAATLDIKFKFGTSSSGATIINRGCLITVDSI